MRARSQKPAASGSRDAYNMSFTVRNGSYIDVELFLGGEIPDRPVIVEVYPQGTALGGSTCPPSGIRLGGDIEKDLLYPGDLNSH